MKHEERLVLGREEVEEQTVQDARWLRRRMGATGEHAGSLARRSLSLAVWLGLCRRFGARLPEAEEVLAAPPVPATVLGQLQPDRLQRDLAVVQAVQHRIAGAGPGIVQESELERRARAWLLRRDEFECALDSLRPVARERGEVRATLLGVIARLGVLDEQALADPSFLRPTQSLCKRVRARAQQTGMRLDARECWWWHEPWRAAAAATVTEQERRSAGSRCEVRVSIPLPAGLAAAGPSPTEPHEARLTLPVSGLPPGTWVTAARTHDTRQLSVLFLDEAGRPTTLASGRELVLFAPDGTEHAAACVEGIEATLALGDMSLEQLAGCRLALRD